MRGRRQAARGVPARWGDDGDGLRRRLQGKQVSPSVSQSVSQHDLVSKLSLVACSLCGSCDRSTYWPPHLVLTGPLT